MSLPVETEGILPEETNITLLNIAGEIVNLGGRADNSGRANSTQFEARYTSNEEEIQILKKIFGVLTLRHTPKILTENGCSLTEKEAIVVKRILEKRKKDLERGASFSRGLTLDSTIQKIRNLAILLKIINELVGADKEACDIQVGSKLSLPKFSLPSISLKKKEESIDKLLLLILMLILGVNSEKIRAKNIQNRLGTQTIDDIVKSIQKKNVRRANVEKILDNLTAEPSVPSVGGGGSGGGGGIEDIENLDTRKEYVDTLATIEKLTDEINKLSKEKGDVEGGLKGKMEASHELSKYLETEKKNVGQISEKIINSIQPQEGDRSSLGDSKNKAEILTKHIAKLNSERIESNQRLQEIQNTLTQLKADKVAANKKVQEILEKIKTALHEKEVKIQFEILKTKEFLEQKMDLEKTLGGNENITAERTTLENTLKTLEADLQKNKDSLHIFENVTFTETALPITSTTPAEKARIMGILSALQEIVAETGDNAAILDVHKLEAALKDIEGLKSQGPDISTFKDTLKNLSLQFALIDDDDDVVVGGGVGGEGVEPSGEKLCLLYYFISIFWKQIESPSSSKSLLDKQFFPNLENAKLWETISLLGKILAALSKKDGVLPEETYFLLESLHMEDVRQITKGATAYNAVLQTIREDNKYLLPVAERQIVSNNEGGWKIQEKTGANSTNRRLVSQADFQSASSILEAPYLFLLEMKLLSRYITYILENAPNKLVCHELGPQTEQF